MRAIDRKLPLASEITLITGFRMGRDKGYEQPAVVDPLANLAIPSVAAPQLALVEEDLDPTCAQCLGNLLGSLSIL